jgi:carbamoyl-phosphate synthase large subunit
MAEQATWPIGAGAGRKRVRVLFTCAGRRVELIQAFQRAADRLRLKLLVHTADVEQFAAAACMANKAHRVPPVASADYIPSLRRIAKREEIDLVIPLIDNELPKLAAARDTFSRFGCCALISSHRVVRICRDKISTFDFLTRHGIDTPETWRARDVLKRRRHQFPYFLKPRKGSASKGNYVLRNRQDLEALAPHVPDAIVQEYVNGVEHTLDVYTGFDGQPRCVVPRERVEVRGGEVTKARTVNHGGIIDVGLRVVEALAECMGLVTIQLFLTRRGRICVIEVNPRFGGGVPLAIQAGADFPKWLLTEWQGRRPRIRIDHFRDDLLMLRYHQSFFQTDASSRS